MSTTEPTAAPVPPYSPTPTPAAPRNPWKIITAVTVAVMLVAVGVLTTVAFKQSDKAEAARDKTAEVTEQRDDARHDLDISESSLSTTKADLASAEEDRDTYSSWVDDCDIAMKAARFMTEAVYPTFEAIDASIITATVKMREATALLEKANRIIDNNGYENIYELYDSCDLRGYGV